MGEGDGVGGGAVAQAWELIKDGKEGGKEGVRKKEREE